MASILSNKGPPAQFSAAFCGIPLLLCVAVPCFVADSGRPWDTKRLCLLHKRVCVMAGLRANRVHDLRHSYATIMRYELHAPIQYVSEQLGHSSIKITVDTYGHPRQGTSIAPADRLDSASALTQQAATQVQPYTDVVA